LLGNIPKNPKNVSFKGLKSTPVTNIPIFIATIFEGKKQHCLEVENFLGAENALSEQSRWEILKKRKKIGFIID
jgi:hypothetical protein